MGNVHSCSCIHDAKGREEDEQRFWHIERLNALKKETKEEEDRFYGVQQQHDKARLELEAQLEELQQTRIAYQTEKDMLEETKLKRIEEEAELIQARQDHEELLQKLSIAYEEETRMNALKEEHEQRRMARQEEEQRFFEIAQAHKKRLDELVEAESRLKTTQELTEEELTQLTALRQAADEEEERFMLALENHTTFLAETGEDEKKFAQTRAEYDRARAEMQQYRELLKQNEQDLEIAKDFLAAKENEIKVLLEQRDLENQKLMEAEERVRRENSDVNLLRHIRAQQEENFEKSAKQRYLEEAKLDQVRTEVRRLEDTVRRLRFEEELLRNGRRTHSAMPSHPGSWLSNVPSDASLSVGSRSVGSRTPAPEIARPLDIESGKASSRHSFGDDHLFKDGSRSS